MYYKIYYSSQAVSFIWTWCELLRKSIDFGWTTGNL